MSKDLNKVMIIGRLGGDPEMRNLASGPPLTKFSVAAGRQWISQDGERRSETEWFNVVAWARLAEICNEYLNKGDRVYVEGRLQTRRWEDSDGNKRSSTEVVANEMLMLSDRPGSGSEKQGEGKPFDDDDQDEFPF